MVVATRGVGSIEVVDDEIVVVGLDGATVVVVPSKGQALLSQSSGYLLT